MEALKTCEPCARKDHKTSKTQKEPRREPPPASTASASRSGTRRTPPGARPTSAVLGDDPNETRGRAGGLRTSARRATSSLVQVLYHNAAARVVSDADGTKKRRRRDRRERQKIFADLGRQPRRRREYPSDLLGLGCRCSRTRELVNYSWPRSRRPGRLRLRGRRSRQQTTTTCSSATTHGARGGLRRARGGAGGQSSSATACALGA